MKRLSLLLIPILLGALVLFRLQQGTLIYYVASRYLWLVGGGGAFLCLLGACGTLFPHAVSHVKQVVKPWQMASVLVPIVLGFLVPPTPLSASTALQRGLGQNLPTYLTPAPFSFAVDSAQRTFGDWARILNSSAEQSSFIGQAATVSGFVSLDGDAAYLTRFQVSCCAADGRPVGIRLNRTTAMQHNTWWQVTGTMQLSPEGDVWLVPETAEPIDIPINPYL